MTFAAELVTAGASMWLCAYMLTTAYERHMKRKEDEKWADDLISRHKAELTHRYKNGQFRAKSMWDQPR